MRRIKGYSPQYWKDRKYVLWKQQRNIVELMKWCKVVEKPLYTRLQRKMQIQVYSAFFKVFPSASPVSQKNNPVSNAVLENKNFDSCVSESACLEPQLEANIPCISANGAKDNNTASVYHLDSESSTTQAET